MRLSQSAKACIAQNIGSPEKTEKIIEQATTTYLRQRSFHAALEEIGKRKNSLMESGIKDETWEKYDDLCFQEMVLKTAQAAKNTFDEGCCVR